MGQVEVAASYSLRVEIHSVTEERQRYSQE